MNKIKSRKVARMGFSLIEMLIVITAFSVLGILVSTTTILTLKGAKKSDSLIKVRENINYAMAVVERQLRNAEEISPCPNTDPGVIEYVASDGVATDFSCSDVGDDGYIASGSGRLTSDNISIVACTFTCTQSNENDPPSVTIDIAARDKEGLGTAGALVTITMQIIGRNY